jgi:hypothetical protein
MSLHSRDVQGRQGVHILRVLVHACIHEQFHALSAPTTDQQ